MVRANKPPVSSTQQRDDGGEPRVCAHPPAQQASPAPSQPRRSPRMVVAASRAPSPFAIMRMEAADRSVPVRTRRVTQQIRAAGSQKPVTGSPHDQPAHRSGADTSSDQDSADGDSEDDDEEEKQQDEDEEQQDEEDEDDEEPGAKGRKPRGRRASDRVVDRVGIVQVSNSPVEVPAPELEHTHWKAWHEHLAVYSDATNQKIVVKYTLNTQAKNQKRAALVNPKPPLPEEIGEVFQRTYHCTHSWKLSNRGTGSRPKRFVRGVGCPFSFRIQWEERKGKNEGDSAFKWRLVVHPGCMWHNHRLTPEVLSTYPSKRLRTAKPENLQRAREWDDLGVPREQIHDMFLDNGENLYKDDVDNFVSQHRADKSRADDDEAAAKLLYNYSLLNNGGLVTIDETNEGKTGVLSITTQHMREMFERFGELLLIDCTHKTNKNNYQLCTIMVMDEYGHGQVVQQSLFERNADWHMERALDHMQKANADAWYLVRVIMVDKDLNEIRVLRARFPGARILICLFHVIKYLGKMAFKTEFGKLSKDDHSVLETLIHNLVYSDSAGAYKGNLYAMEVFCTNADFTKFYDYVLKNWDDCTDMWVMFQRADLPHFRNHTNNRLENYFGKFKKGVKPTSTMADCVDKLLKGARRSTRQREFDNRVGRDWNANYDEEMNNVLRFTTLFVASSVFPEYARALDQASVYAYQFPDGPNGQCVEVVGKTYTHRVDLTDWSCDCAFAVTMRLPCRHSMAYRKMHGRSTIPLERIDDRWQRATRVLPSLKPFEVRHHTYKPAKEAVVRGSGEAAARARYTQAMQVLGPIASELAEITVPAQFKEYCDFLLEQWNVVRQRTAPAVARLRRVEAVDVEDGGATSDAPDHGRSMDEERPDLDGSDVAREDMEEQKGLHDDHDEEKVGPEEDQPVELSQANSLYSPELGRTAMVDAAAVTILEPTELISDGKISRHGQDMDEPRSAVDGSDVAKDEVGAHAEDAQSQGKASDTARPLFKELVPINFNKKAPKHGHPSVDAKKAATATKVTRVQYNEAQAAAKVRGVGTLADLLDNLNNTQDGIHATLIAINCVPERHGDHKNSKPKLESHTKPVLTTSDFFLLPKTLVAACMKKLPSEPPIAVYTPTGLTPPPPSSKNKAVQVLRIANIGLFSVEQIRLMNKAITLREACLEGEKFCEWLDETLVAAVPLGQQQELASVSDQVKARFPFAPIPDVPNSNMVMLYRIMPSSLTKGWFCAGLIRAFGTRMESKYEFVRFAGVFEPDPRKKRGKPRQVVSGEALLHEVVERQLQEEGVTTVCAIVNHGNSHWTSLVVDGETKNVAMYDSFGASARFEAMAWDLAKKLGVQFDVTAINSPRQVDGHSCGILSCYKFWQKADSTIPRSMEAHALPRRQFEFLYFVMTGKVIE